MTETEAVAVIDPADEDPAAGGVVVAARIVAKHLTAMADELEALNGEVMPSEPVPDDR